ncbi:type II toxin-antitoxin system PemK/MazF family toxin [Candidatus Micrarchaeota archaeon]|nr:type II toxin-antitoxin system PemK/MazF family toxin [Candidatus Micrarchaeota archaeon]
MTKKPSFFDYRERSIVHDMTKRREVVLAKVYFTDSSESKTRPAIVLSNDTYHEDDFLLVASITTANDEYCMPLSEKDVNCILDKNSGARFDGIIKIHKKQVQRIIGKVTPEFHSKLVEKIISRIN